ncbi:Zn-ribbon domain-containing OB-fold protein [Streptomyces sp. CA-179760]|uniref:Zn-ribbon domain-containing OB-fold protein n=1 Tax=Streptomyces sp. CA-179760 TaxID=3240054 RepID=UPI003D8B6C7E
MLRPVTDPDGTPFWEYAARGELRVQACSGCGELRFPPRPCCPHCQSFASEWRRVSGGGRVWSYVVPHPPLLPGYSELAPYNVVVVELDEAPRVRLVGNLVAEPGAAIDSVPAERLRIGARVRAVLGDGLPAWVLERS